MFGIPVSFIIICIVFSAWCALHDHLNGTMTPAMRRINFVLEIALFIYTVWSFGIVKALVLGVAFAVISGLFGVVWDMLGLRKI